MSHKFSSGRVASYKNVLSSMKLCSWVIILIFQSESFLLAVDKLKKTSITIMEFYIRKYLPTSVGRYASYNRFGVKRVNIYYSILKALYSIMWCLDMIHDTKESLDRILTTGNKIVRFIILCSILGLFILCSVQQSTWMFEYYWSRMKIVIIVVCPYVV